MKLRQWIKKASAILLTSLALAAAPTLGTNFINTVTAEAASNTYRVQVTSGYLALRNAKAYDVNNEIGKLYTGETVTVQDTSDSTYWYVYAPTLGKSGYVNRNYLVAVSSGTSTPETKSVTVPAYTVKVSSGYLALRNARATDPSNEIGELYTGAKVLVTDNTVSGDFWYVYAPSLSKMGYVNKNYLISGATLTVAATSYKAKVSSGYLALRTAQAFDSSNEIGKIYTGDTVYVLSGGSGTYWYAYAPTLGKFGYVNKDYLVTGNVSSYTTMTVKVSSGYLALRNAKAYDASNEIGKLYTGDTVQVTDKSGSQYWYVYSPKLDKYGYVNKDYLY